MAEEYPSRTSNLVRPRWNARLALQRAIQRGRLADPDRERQIAQERAAAAERIAREENGARLNAILDAARDQATAKAIAIVDRRFAVARKDRMAAHQALLPSETKSDGGITPPIGPAPAVPSGWDLQHASVLEPKGQVVPLRPGVVWSVIIAAVVGAAYLLYPAPDTPVGRDDRAAGSAASPATTSGNSAMAPTAGGDPVKSTTVPAPVSPPGPGKAEIYGPPRESVTPAVRAGVTGAAEPPAESVKLAVAEAVAAVAVAAPMTATANVVTQPRVRRPIKRVRAPIPGRNPFRAAPAVPVTASQNLRVGEVE